jgi:hypothetical protein
MANIKKVKLVSDKVAVTLRRADGVEFDCTWVAVRSKKANHVDIMPFQYGSSGVFTIHQKQLDNALTGIPVIIEEMSAEQLKRRVFDAQINAGIAANYDAELGDCYADPGASRY